MVLSFIEAFGAAALPACAEVTVKAVMGLALLLAPEAVGPSSVIAASSDLGVKTMGTSCAATVWDVILHGGVDCFAQHWPHTS